MTKVVTGKVRFSYVNVFEPKAMEEGQTPKYSVSLIIPKSDIETIKKVKKAIEEATLLGKDKAFQGKIPKGLKNPLRDGDAEREGDEAYANAYFINANANEKNKPIVVDKNIDPILDREEFYSGCYGRAEISFYAYNKNGNRGVASGLNLLQKLRDGEPLSGAVSNPKEAFSDGFIDDEDDTDSNFFSDDDDLAF